MYFLSHILKSPCYQSLHMKLICDDFCLRKANPCTASEQITHIHDNIFDLFSVIKHGEIRIKTFCFSIGQYIYHLFLFRIGQYTLKLLPASVSPKLVYGDDFRKMGWRIGKKVKASGNCSCGNIYLFSDGFHGMYLCKCIQNVCP